MNERLLTKLRRLLALTNNPSENEAAVAAGMLARLLTEHNLEMADLEQKGGGKPGIREERHDLGKAAFKWKLALAEEIAEHYFCVPLIDRYSKLVTFIGRPDNVDALRMLYGWLIDQIKRAATAERRKQAAHMHVDPLRWQCGFGDGAAARLGERLRELAAKRASEAGTALVRSHAAEVSDYLEKTRGYRVDGQMTAREREREAEYAKQVEQMEQREREMAALKENDPAAYYRLRPWEDPAHIEKELKREARNARRRTGRAWRGPSAEEVRKEGEKQDAARIGRRAADAINLTPFIEGATERKAVK